MNTAVAGGTWGKKPLGVYKFCKGDFSDGKWGGLDILTAPGTDTFKESNLSASASFNLGVALGASVEAKINLEFSGKVRIDAIDGLASKEIEEDGATASISGFPHGTASANVQMKVITGVGVTSGNASGVKWINSERIEATIQAVEDDADCN